MIGNGDVQTTRLRFVDENGKQLQNDAFVSTNIGEKLNVTAPAIAGYNLSNASAKQLNDVANEKGIKDITLIYMSSSEGETGQSTVKNPTKDTDKSGVKNPGKSVVKTPAKPANVASKLNQKVVLSRSEGYKIWQDFSWKK
ncbi:hypothetical protein EFL41_11345, partial [Weissella cibaria]|nr:hypothetical protein [Weissella cibaria]MCT0954105.1 hypothetical protein [Weissella cibaria]